MKYFHCDITEFLNRNKGDRNIILFGAGGNVDLMEMGPLKVIANQISAVIDNGDKTQINAFGKTIPVYKPDYVKGVGKCSIIETSCIYVKEMTEQLLDMDLSDDVELYMYSMMSALEENPLTQDEYNYLFDTTRTQKIPKILHGFWFSGDEKPEAYQRCFDSWSRMCPDFEIREWTKENYDYKKHPFVKKAVEVGAWAAATDFARIDIIEEQGGIYMDMDVEVLKPLDFILGHESVFTFYSDGVIDPAAFAAVSHNNIVKSIRREFDAVEIPSTKDAFKEYYTKYFLPYFASVTIEKYGIDMNGKFQNLNDNLFLPRYLMMPRDCIVYNDITNEDTFMIHRSNIGWKEESHQKNRMNNSREIIKKLTNGQVEYMD